MNKKIYEKEILEEMKRQQRDLYASRPPGFFASHKWHIIFLAVLVTLTAITCVPMHRLGDSAGITSAAQEQLQLELDAKSREYKDLEEERDELNHNIEILNQSSAETGDINVLMKEHEDKIAVLNTSIKQAQELSDSLDNQLEAQRETSTQVNSMSNATSGQTRTLKVGEYLCPSELNEGTYKLSGKTGNIILYDNSGSIRLTKNLEKLDGNEFTLTIKEGEKLKVDKDIKIATIN